MSIPDPDFYPSRISDPTIVSKEEGKIFFLLSYHFFCIHNNHKIVSKFIFEQVKKFFCLIFAIVLFNQKFVINPSKIWVWDPGSRVKKAPDPGSAKLSVYS
jgi:hypothetical protein